MWKPCASILGLAEPLHTWRMNDSNVVSIRAKRLHKLLSDILHAAPTKATEAQVSELLELLPDLPVIARCLADPNFVKVAYDDIENLIDCEKLFARATS